MEEGGILLVGYEDQENLGLRYLAAYLEKRGIRVLIAPFQYDHKEDLLALIRTAKPNLVGFSLIFQRMVFDFKGLMSYLRESGVTCHFTIGGHFPSLEPRLTLDLMPELDSVARFEGEETLFELSAKIAIPSAWGRIAGLAYREGGDIRVNQNRPLLLNLDSLPFPVREQHAALHRGMGISSILASRGCYYDCSFCSIHQFYREPPGPLRRTRSPSNIVREMEELFHKKNTRVFIFQDDEWFMKGSYHIQWINDFVQELNLSSIRNEILWRISCRIDDVNASLLNQMKDAGLMCVYIGIESGNDQGLRTFNKHYSVSDIFRAVNVLDEIRMPFEFGFMIFDPGSTFDSVLENIAFLRELTNGGRAIAHFCKMVPYAGTTIARVLDKEGRLAGTVASPDYGYHDNRLSILQYFASIVFNYRNFSRDGLVERLRTAKFDSIVLKKYFSDVYDVDRYGDAVRELIQRSNDAALETLDIATRFMSAKTEEDIVWGRPLFYS